MLNGNELRKQIADLLKDNAPMHSRWLVNGSTYCDLQMVCDGSDSTFGYFCVRQPGHDGKCWSATKKVDFTPYSDDDPCGDEEVA